MACHANTAILQATINCDIFIAFVYICNFHVQPKNVNFQIINQSGYPGSMANCMENESRRLLFQIWRKGTKVTNVMISHVEKCTVKRL